MSGGISDDHAEGGETEALHLGRADAADRSQFSSVMRPRRCHFPDRAVVDDAIRLQPAGDPDALAAKRLQENPVVPCALKLTLMSCRQTAQPTTVAASVVPLVPRALDMHLSQLPQLLGGSTRKRERSDVRRHKTASSLLHHALEAREVRTLMAVSPPELDHAAAHIVTRIGRHRRRRGQAASRHGETVRSLK